VPKQVTVVLARDVKVGDVLEVWWAPRRDIVTAIAPYRGPLECMQGGWIFTFALLPVKGGMSVAPGDTFQMITPLKGST
jgi:hypothetical protein